MMHSFLVVNPEWSIDQINNDLVGSCTRCGSDALVIPDQGVLHIGPEETVEYEGEVTKFRLTSRSCRAASFNVETGWNESLPPHWKASLNPNVIARLALV